jgi:hypothetical protein
MSIVSITSIPSIWNSQTNLGRGGLENPPSCAIAQMFNPGMQCIALDAWRDPLYT